MQAKDVMTRDVVTVSPDSSVYDAAAKMLERRVSALPVVSDKGELIGIVSEGDLMRRVEAGTEARRSWWLGLLTTDEDRARSYVKSHGRRVDDVMTRAIRSAALDTPLDEIATMLERNGMKRVPILEGKRLVGIVSRADLLRALAVRKLAGAPIANVSDQELRRKVDAALWDETRVGWRVSAVVDGGVVHLWGFVASEPEQRAARIAAETVPGVQRVESNVTVAPHLFYGAE